MIDAVLANVREFWLVHTLLLFYTAMLAHHAWTGNKSTKGLADYYVGGRGMGGLVLGLSFFATYSSTNSFVGFSGQAYTWGIPWMLFVPTAVAFCLFAWTVVAPRLRAFTGAMGSLTLPDFIGFRFGSPTARVLAALIVVVASIFYMTAVFKGIGNLLEVFMDIPYRLSIGIVFVIVMLYTMVGGFISVVKTDAVQGGVMMIAAILMFTSTVSAAGGLGALSEIRAQPGGAELFELGGGVGVPLLLGTLFAGLVKFAVEPRQLSRFFALRDDKAIRQGMWVSTLTFAGVYSLLIPIGIYARKIFPTGIEDTDLVIPTLLTETFGAGTAAFLLVAMVAAAMSSLDSVLLVTASTAERDLRHVLRPGRTDDQAMKGTKFWVVLFAAVTAVISLDPPGGIVVLTAFSGALYGACFVPAVILGLHWKRGSGASVIASFAAGVVVLLAWDLVPGSEIVHEVFPAVLGSTATYVGVALMTPPSADPLVMALLDGQRMDDAAEAPPAGSAA
ncbi:MAG: hypothetical protein RJQ04_00660 [Longimicrobiales bacterium]